MVEIAVSRGDVTQFAADALISAVASSGPQKYFTDYAIDVSSGAMFAAQVAEQVPLANGQVVFAPETGPHGGKFHAVLYVVDGPMADIYKVVMLALITADYRKCKSVSISTSVICGVRSPRGGDLRLLAKAVKDFAAQYCEIRTITIVCDKDVQAEAYLTNELMH